MLLCVNNCLKSGKVYRNLAVVQQKIHSYLTRFKNVAFHANFFTHYDIYDKTLEKKSLSLSFHHVVCLRAPTILNPPLGNCSCELIALQLILMNTYFIIFISR